MSKNILLPILIIVTIVGGIFVLGRNNSSQPTTNNKQLSTKQQPTTNPKFDKIFKNYSTQELEKANESDIILIFFAADWCPTCKAAERDISLNVEKLPDNILILKANYDTERTLKKKYGVTTQHTFVQINKAGEEITKWIGGGVATINDNLK